MKTYCPTCYRLKQMHKRALAYRGYKGYYGGLANSIQPFRVAHRKTHTIKKIARSTL